MEIKKNKLEYVWLDGYKPEPTLRSKIKIIDRYCTNLLEVPEWGFDGSSTQQAQGSDSDCVLKPVRLFDSPFNSDQLVLCEVYNADGTPHVSNERAKITNENQKEYWFGFEQEYTFIDNDRPLGWPETGTPKEQGDYYCGVGTANVGRKLIGNANRVGARMFTGRDIMHEHISNCLKAGISIHGTNAEVMLGQWEYQVFGRGAKKASDNAWMARYILYRTAEKYGIDVNIEPKPIKGNWNGNGMHTNFSTNKMRNEGGEEYIKSICEKFKPVHKEHIADYGSKNEERLTGLHETQHIDTFSYGVSDRGASIRIPMNLTQNNWKGYLEDRRPSGNADPYRVTNRILTTMES